MSTTTLSRAAIAFCACLLLSTRPAASQSNPKFTEGLVRESEVIVAGRVGDVVSEWTPKRERIQTRVTLNVDEALKGSVAGNSITILVPGGEVGGVGELYTHTPSFRNNEEVVVFARKDARGHYRVAGGKDGKFIVEKDARTGAKTIQHVGSFDAFKRSITKTVQSPQGGKQ